MNRLTLLLLLFTFSANAQWQQTSGPYGSTITCLTRIPTGILAGSPNGIYFSNDEGETWSDYPFFQNCWTSSIISDSNEIMITYQNNFLSGNYSDSTFFCKSFDLGLTWTTPIGFKQHDFNASFLYQMQNLLFIYSDKEIFKSTDNGNNWTSTTIPNGEDIYSINFFDKYAIVQQDSIGSGYYVNSYFCDSAFNFYPVSSPLRNIGLIMQDSVTFANKNIGSYNWQIIKSSDLGLTSTVIQTVTNPSFNLCVYKDSLYYNGSGGQYYVSSDFGVTFSTTAYPHFLNYNYALPLINGDELSVHLGHGLVHYIPAIDSSYDSFQGMRGLYTGIYSNNSKLYCSKHLGYYISSDDGNTWQDVTIPCIIFYGLPLFAGDTIYFSGELSVDCRSIDGGITWTSALRNGLPSSFSGTAYLKNNNLYTYDGDFYRSSNLGDNWIRLPNTPYISNCGQTFSSNGPICSHNNNIFCVSTNGSIFKLAPNDASWTYLYCFPYDIWTSGSTNIISTGNKLIASVDSTFYISDDDGQNWYIPRMDGLPRWYLTNAKIMPTSLQGVGTDLLGVCGRYGIYISSNNGDDWQPFPSNICPFAPTSIAVCNNKLFAGSSNNSVWGSTFILSTEENLKEQKNFTVYPNPTNDYFSIQNSRNSKTDVQIFDNFGKKICEYLNLESDYQISTKNLFSGIYIVQISDSTNNKLQRVKLVVVK